LEGVAAPTEDGGAGVFEAVGPLEFDLAFGVQFAFAVAIGGRARSVDVAGREADGGGLAFLVHVEVKGGLRALNEFVLAGEAGGLGICGAGEAGEGEEQRGEDAADGAARRSAPSQSGDQSPHSKTLCRLRYSVCGGHRFYSGMRTPVVRRTLA